MDILVLDIGTNSVIVLAFTRDAIGNMHIVYENSKEPRLGENLYKSGELNKHAIERTIDVIEELISEIPWQKPDCVIAVGTHALRIAKNTESFISIFKKRIGYDLLILSSEDEAKYSYYGANFGLKTASKVIIADVGGGSTEISFNDENGISHQSIELGAVVISEEFEVKQPMQVANHHAMKMNIDDRLDKLSLPQTIENRNVVASGGTATTIAMLHAKFPEFDVRKIHGYRIKTSELENLVANLVNYDINELRSRLFFAPARADIITAGATIYLQLLKKIGAIEMIISQKGLRWGIAYKINDFI